MGCFGSSQKVSDHKVVARKFSFTNPVICRFCGGATCKHEDWTRCENPAIEGLHSNWITASIIASQRLSSPLIKEHNIVRQFNELGVTAVFNLQEPGEHPHCGHGIDHKVGFSYNPEELYHGGVHFYNFHWEDLTNPSFDMAMNVV